MPITTTSNITNLQEKVIGPARMTLKDDVLAIKGSFKMVRGGRYGRYLQLSKVPWCNCLWFV